MTNSVGVNSAMTREITLTRLFDAPRDLVWQAWTEPEHMAQWFGPRGFTIPLCELDVRVGGALRMIMRAPDGADYPMQGVFREIVKPERLVFTNIPVDKDGKHLVDGLTTVTFEQQGDKTKLTLHTRGVGLVDYAARMLAGMEAGWSESLHKLAEFVERPGG